VIHPHTETRFSGDGVGDGVFATALIPRGTIVYVKDQLDILISPAEYRKSPPGLRAIIERYSYIEANGVRVVSWDAAKYVNHSCEPNTMSTGWSVEIAVRDIEAGEEITDEYGMFNLPEPMRCDCRRPVCRGQVTAADMDSHHDSWDQIVTAALVRTAHVDQPLLEYLVAAEAAALYGYLAGTLPYRSVARLRAHSPRKRARRMVRRAASD
jgi:uncharacterized protein